MTDRAANAAMAGRLIGGAMLGKLLGFVREVEMAQLIGASVIADSFRGALSTVLLPINPLQGEIIPAVLIPLHREWSAAGKAVRLFGSLMVTFLVIAILLAIAVWFSADHLVRFLMPGFAEPARIMTARFVRIMALSIPSSVMLSNVMCMELAIGRSRITAIRASVQNVALMIGVAILAITGWVDAIAWAFVIAFNAVTLYGCYALWREGELHVRAVSLRDAWRGMREFFPRVRPLLAQPLFDQSNIILERVLASAVAVGAIASLDYARTLSESLLYMLAQPVGFIVLAGGTPSPERVRFVSRAMLGIALPISCFFAILAPDIVRVLLERGAFGEAAVQMTAGVVRGVGLGLWAASLGFVLIRMLNASGRNHAAACVIMAAYSANMLTNLFAVPAWGTFGLGVGESVRALVMLVGAAMVLGCLRSVISACSPLLVQVAAVAAACVAAISLTHASLPRVLIGGTATCGAVLAWYAIALPELTGDRFQRAFRWLRGRAAAMRRV